MFNDLLTSKATTITLTTHEQDFWFIELTLNELLAG